MDHILLMQIQHVVSIGGAIMFQTYQNYALCKASQLKDLKKVK
jgi:hypothetical protein